MKKTIGSIVGLGAFLVASQAFAQFATITPTLPSVAKNAAACTLSNGNVVFAGGENQSNVAVDTWVEVTSAGVLVKSSSSVNSEVMTQALTRGRMISDGSKCYYIGGDTGPGTAAVANVDVYDPTATGANIWIRTTGVLAAARSDFEIVPITGAANRFLMVAGKNNATELATMEVVNINGATPASAFLTNGGNVLLQDPKTDFVVLEDPNSAGDFYVFGGLDSGTELVSADLITVTNAAAATGTQSPLADLDADDVECTDRASHVGFPVSLTAGDFLITGGQDATNELKTACVYSIGNDEWTYVPSLNLPVASSRLKVAPIGSGDMRVVGGVDEALRNSIGNVYQWDDSADDWVRNGGGGIAVESLIVPRNDFVLQASGAVTFAAGGEENVFAGTVLRTVLNSIERKP